jgi:hypothetical protein
MCRLCLLGFSAVSCTLWLEISAFFQKTKNKMMVREFFSISINFALIFLVFFALAMTLRQFGLPAAVLEVLISIIFATLIILLLNLVVFKIKFLNAFSISLDTWKKLPYLGMSLSFSVFILFSACVFLGQQVLASYFLGEFSVFKASATIWIFGLGSVVVLSFVLALFNCFWVLCVLEKIRPLKTKELDKTEISVAVSKPAI